MLKNILKKQLRKSGYEIKKVNPTILESGFHIDMIEPEFVQIYQKCKPHSTCTIEPLYTLFKAVEYIVKNNIEGDIVECGVYKGGSAMLIAYTLLHFKDKNRNIYLYDTFEGMSEPDTNDIDFSGESAKNLMNESDKEKGKVWCYAPIDLVKQNMLSTGYDSNKLFFIKGKVEETIPGTLPKTISLLRLDTDWYESTKHELEHLYPLLINKGVLIVDDYGHWQGVRKAVDEYFEKQPHKILLNRVDYTVRMGIKTSD